MVEVAIARAVEAVGMVTTGMQEQCSWMHGLWHSKVLGISNRSFIAVRDICSGKLMFS